jgi:hypothetical protein
VKLIEKLLRRRLAYRRMFLGDDNKPHADAEIVLRDLARFCRARSTTIVVSPRSGTVDPIASGVLEGRREVWNRVIAHLYAELDEERITQLAQTENDNE